MREWNAATYHRVSAPQFDWGLAVLERLPLAGHELVVDVGCGTGRLTSLLLDRLPHGAAVAVDLSANMLHVARAEMPAGHQPRVHFVLASALALPVHERADAVFSTATFHWVLDHPALFRSLHDALRPGGVLVAQCGGAGNLARIHARADALMRQDDLAPFFSAWTEPWEFADAATTAARLADAGFAAIATNVEATPFIQPDADAYAVFVRNVICRPHLACLPDEPRRAAFIDALTRLAAQDDPPFELDYWRLNMSARRPLR